MEYPRYVYALQNKENKKIYVGSCFDLQNRYLKHMEMLKGGIHFVKEMQKDYNDGLCEFDLFVLDEIFDANELNKEYQWIKKLHSSINENGYNTLTSNPHHIPSCVKNGLPVFGWKREDSESSKVQIINDSTNSNIYENIKFFSRQKNIPIYLLEQKAGLGNGTIGKWKDGEATIGSLKKVADALGVDVKKLI